MVVVDPVSQKPKGSLGKDHSGGSVAAPALREILEKTLNYLEPMPYYTLIPFGPIVTVV